VRKTQIILIAILLILLLAVSGFATSLAPTAVAQQAEDRVGAQFSTRWTYDSPGKAVGNLQQVHVCGEVPAYIPSSRYGEQTWNGTGCWLAQPLALYNPAPELESFLSPGKYKIKVRVGCDTGEGDSREFILQSPISWEELRLLLPT